ncbi:MAG: hypothetical protein AB9900_00555 [Humidesulfovibrio sp.]
MRTPQPSLLPRAALLAALALLLLALPGCLNMPRMLGGTGDATLVLDGEQGHEVTLRQGHTLTLDMRDPALSGYVFAGTSFAPDLLRLDGIEPRTGGRVRYLFTATAKGQSDIQIKIKKNEPGYRPDVYKRVRVTID